MPTNQKPVLFKHHPVTHQKMLSLAEQHGIASKGATVAKYIISKILKIDSVPEVHSVLAIEGGNTLNLIERAVHEYLHKRGYLRDKRSK